MGFDVNKFAGQVFSDRTQKYEIPAHSGLRAFFGDEDEKSFTVRGLTASEMGRTNDAVAKNRDVAAMIEALIGGDPAQKSAALQQMIRPDTPDDVAKRLEMVHIGLVDPKLNFPDVVRMAENFPVEFYEISNRIMNLTGMGRLPGKPECSTGNL